MFVQHALIRLSPLVGLAALLACAEPDEAEDAPAGPRRPDVLLITLDTTRADALGCYGAGPEASPRLDALAAVSTRFDQAIVQAAVTPVSHASILTGLEPYTHGVRVLHGKHENTLPEGAVMLSEVLQDEGYATGAFLSAFPVSERFGFRQGFDVFDQDFLQVGRASVDQRTGAVDTGNSQRRADATTDAALRWLGDTEGPRFAWVHYFDPHDGLVVPPEDFSAAWGTPPENEREAFRMLYRMEVAFMDREIGRLLDAFDLEHTVVAVISDHGEGLGDHDWWTHGVLYQEQIRAPLLIHAPGVGAGRVVDQQVRSIDLMPTLLELASVPESRRPPMDGQSLGEHLRGGGGAASRTAYADSVNMLTYRYTPRLIDQKNDMHFAILDGGWKYVHHALREERSELYDLREDPRELHNLYTERPDQVERLQALLRQRDFVPREQPGTQNMSDEDRRRLELLGYTDPAGPGEDGDDEED